MSDLIKAMQELLVNYQKALRNKCVLKKVSWALYQTWKYFDAIESDYRELEQLKEQTE